MALSNKRVIANQCLLVALVLYIISAILIGTYPALGYLKAFAEAAIVVVLPTGLRLRLYLSIHWV